MPLQPTVTWEKTLTETITIGDSIAKQTSTENTEVLSISDSASKKPQKEATETITLSDSKLKHASKVLSENLNLSDAVTKAIVLSALEETLTISDSMSKQMNKLLSDTITIADSVLKKPYKILSELLTLSDVFTKTYIIIKELTETLTLSDSISKSVSFHKTITENLTLDDAINFGLYMTLTEQLNISDELSKKAIKEMTDNLTLSDYTEWLKSEKPNVYRSELDTFISNVKPDVVNIYNVPFGLHVTRVDTEKPILDKATGETSVTVKEEKIHMDSVKTDSKIDKVKPDIIGVYRANTDPRETAIEGDIIDTDKVINDKPHKAKRPQQP